MPKAWETRFFVDDALFEQGIAHYEMTVFGAWDGEEVVGEKTPEYLLFDDTPERVRNYLGEDVRLVVCLRHPLRRALSHYRHNLAARVEHLPFADALAQEAERIAGNRARTAYFGYAHRGRYRERLKPWLDIFPKDNFLFLDFEELIVPDSACHIQQQLADHLGIASPLIAPWERSGRPILPSWHVANDHISAGSAAKMPSAHLQNFAAKASQLAPPILNEAESRALMQQYWDDDFTELSGLTGLALADWGLGPAIA